MHIVVGYDFDSAVYPDALAGQEAVSGRVLLGRAGLLSVLETRLGLKGPEIPPAVRVGQYLDSLRAADNGNRFYSRSFEADAWSTAQELLKWRDHLLTSGWDKTLPPGASNRLADIAEVEAAAENLLSPGFGERLWRVYQRLQSSSNVGINSVSISEPEEFWPKPWQELFHAMTTAKIDCKFLDAPEVNSNGDLAQLQECLRLGNRSRKQIAGDGSLMLVVGQTEADAAEALAEWLAAEKQFNKDVVLIRGTGSSLLDEALHRKGLPRLGRDSRSRWRAALQVLLLAIENAWKPVNPHLLLEILTLPYSPVPKSAGWYFVQALKDNPGIGGELWQEAHAKAIAQEKERLEKESVSPDKAAKKLKNFEENLNFWLGLERFHPDEGIPAQAALNICARVARLASVKGGYEGNPLLLLARDQAMELADAVKASNLERITRPQLNRMVDEVFQFGGATPGSGAEASPWSTVKKPGQIRDAADTIIWWGFVDPGEQQTPHNWTRSEIEALAAAGVHMEKPREKRLREAMLWQRPVMLAQKRLLLFTHRSEAAEPTSYHPLWEEIKQAVLPTAAYEQRITVDAGNLRKQQELRFGTSNDARVINRREMAPVDRPAAISTWEIPPNEVDFREKESASSLEKLISCPLAWVLNYHARIKKGALLSLPQDLRLTGILAHAVVERLLKEPARLTPAEAKARSVVIYDELLPKMAAEWLQPGRAVERQRNRESISNAASALVKLLNDCSLTVEGTEKQFSRLNKEMGATVNGTLDLVLNDTEGLRIVMDLKWASSSKYRREELEDGSAVQLATYSWLLGEGVEVISPAGYYMLSQKELLTPDVSRFPDQVATAGPPLSEVWDSVVTECIEKMNSLRSGVAIAPGARDDSEENPKACRFCEYSILCGVHQEDRK